MVDNTAYKKKKLAWYTDRFWAEAVSSSLENLWFKEEAKDVITAPKPETTTWIKTPSKIWTPVNKTSLTETKWFKQDQVWIPWVNLTVPQADTTVTEKTEDIVTDFWKTEDKITTWTTWAWTTWVTWDVGQTDIQKATVDWIIQPEELTGDYKTFYDTLSDTEKKMFLAVWENAMKNNLDITEAYANYMRDYETKKTRMEEDEAYRLKQQWISEEMAEIQESQTMRRAKDWVNKLKQSIAYMWDLWMPWKSAQRVVNIENQVTEAEKTLSELAKLQSLAKSSRALWKAKQAEQYEQQMEDITTTLNDNIDKSIQDAFNTLIEADNNGKLETVEELTAFRDKLYSDLDMSITGFSDASISQMQFLINEVDNARQEALQYQQLSNTINSEMSIAQWFYVDWNGNPVISATTGQRIQIPQESPMEPIFDKNTGRLITFGYDENWNIMTNVDQVYDTQTFEEETFSNYAKLYANWKISIWDMQDMWIPNEQIANIVWQSAWITPTEEFKTPDVERIWTDEDWNPIYWTYNQATWQYEPISISWWTTWTTWKTQMLDFIKSSEWYSNLVYDDMTGGVLSPWQRAEGTPTIWYWFTTVAWQPVTAWMQILENWDITDVNWNVISNVDTELQNQIQQHSNYQNFITVPLSEAQQTALTSFEYNLWPNIWKWDWKGIIDKINAWDLEWAVEEMKLFTYANWEYMEWLANRRNKEADLLMQWDTEDIVWFDKNKMPQYIKFIESWSLPTWMKSWTKKYEQFIKEANEWYKQNSEEILRNKGFSITSPETYNALSTQEKKDIITMTNSFWAFWQSMDKLIWYAEKYWTKTLPWTVKKTIEQERQNALLQAKELFNLWVLNWPDLELMEKVIPSITASWVFQMFKWAITDEVELMKWAKQTVLDNANITFKNAWISQTWWNSNNTVASPTWNTYNW